MHFEPLPQQDWPRREHFEHYFSDVRCIISLTDDIDITDLMVALKNTGRRFFPCVLYLVSKAVNRRKEFRMGTDAQGRPGFWDRVCPAYTVFHPQDETFSCTATEWVPDPDLFYQAVVRDLEACARVRGLSAGEKLPNCFDVSCLPWRSFRSFDLQFYDAASYLPPIVTWGKYRRENDRILLPLTFQIHHAAADGFHVCRFFSDIEQEKSLLIQHLTKKGA